MRNPFRLVRRVLAGIGVLVLLLVAAVFGLLWLSTPSKKQQLAIEGLSAPVNVTFDADGVPRIHAASALDGAAALGFVHARDRMFQMELMRRAASGRLSEIAGPVTLPLDRQMRVLGLRQRALADYPALPEPTRAMLEAYARGVNAWIAARGRFSAPEFLALGAPEQWEPVDSLLWGKTMGLWLSDNWRTELSRLSFAGRLSQQQIDELWPPDHADGHPDARAATDRRYAAAAAALLDLLPKFPAPFTLPGQRLQRMGGRWAAYRDRRAAARRRPASAIRPARHLVSGADRDAGRRAGGRHRAGGAVPRAGP